MRRLFWGGARTSKYGEFFLLCAVYNRWKFIWMSFQLFVPYLDHFTSGAFVTHVGQERLHSSSISTVGIKKKLIELWYPTSHLTYGKRDELFNFLMMCFSFHNNQKWSNTLQMKICYQRGFASILNGSKWSSGFSCFVSHAKQFSIILFSPPKMQFWLAIFH